MRGQISIAASYDDAQEMFYVQVKDTSNMVNKDTNQELFKVYEEIATLEQKDGKLNESLGIAPSIC